MAKPKRKYRIRKDQPVGNRSASGRLRNREPKRVEPCDGVIRKRQAYGVAVNDTDYADAIGRAFTAGLLGSDERAKDIVIAARKVAWQYWRIFKPQFPTPDSLARFQPQAPAARLDPEREHILEDALNDSLDSIGRQGRNIRAAFDQLVIDLHPDCGPPWLDRIIFAHRSKRTADARDLQMLEWAKEGLAIIA